jgi:hypothetical protein
VKTPLHCKGGAGQCFRTSILLSQHNRQHAGDDRFSICALDIWLLIQIDLEHDGVAVHVKCPKVVLFVRVIGVAKVVEHRDGFDDPLNRLGDCAVESRRRTAAETA